MLILFSMQQSFRLESRIFWEEKEKKKLWNHCLTVPQDSSSLMDFGKEVLALPHSWSRGFGFLVLYVFTLLNTDKLCFSLFFSPLSECRFADFLCLRSPNTPPLSLFFFRRNLEMENPSQMDKVQGPSWIPSCHPICGGEKEGHRLCVWAVLRQQLPQRLSWISQHRTCPCSHPGAGPGTQQPTLQETITDTTK